MSTNFLDHIKEIEDHRIGMTTGTPRQQGKLIEHFVAGVPRQRQWDTLR